MHNVYLNFWSFSTHAQCHIDLKVTSQSTRQRNKYKKISCGNSLRETSFQAVIDLNLALPRS